MLIELCFFEKRGVELQMGNGISSNGIIVVPEFHVRGWGWGNVVWGLSTGVKSQ
jgi:hypothetical protein